VPDLGSYSVYVLSAYGVSIAAVVWLVWWSIRRSAKVKRQLQKLEGHREDA
jgi:heme exporter protein D